MKSFISSSPGSYYQEACVRKGWCKTEQHIVVDFDKWLHWYNQADTHNPILPPPAFVGDTYEIVAKVCDELNAGIKS